MIHKLDLGGTACYESKDAVSISLDGTTSDDEVVHNVIGNYRQLPFVSGQFTEALGSCLLEEPDEQYHDIYTEIARVLKPTARLYAQGCGDGHTNHAQHALDVGFLIESEGCVYEDEDSGERWYSDPYIFLRR